MPPKKSTTPSKPKASASAPAHGSYIGTCYIALAPHHSRVPALGAACIVVAGQC